MTDHLTENTAPSQRGRPFEKGQSGNPNGRPKGARNKATILAEGMLDGETEAVVKKLLEKALEGDSAALRLCVERLLPSRQERSVSVELPNKLKTSDECLAASSSVISECAAGDLAPSEAERVISMIRSHMQLIEITEIESRLMALESRTENDASHDRTKVTK